MISYLSSSRAAARCTGPMKDPGPPPMTPKRMRLPNLCKVLFIAAPRRFRRGQASRRTAS